MGEALLMADIESMGSARTGGMLGGSERYVTAPGDGLDLQGRLPVAKGA
jgi:hypothetical protein